MLISTEDNEPNIRPKNLIAAVSIFVSTVGFWQVQAPESTPITVQGLTAVMAETTELATDSVEKLVLYNPHPIKTETSVKKEVVFEQELIPFETEISYDANQEVGYETVTQYGEDGYYDRSYEVEMFFGEELSRTLLSEQITEPIPEQITRGTKPMHIETPQGDFSYTQTIDVWATSYDGNCTGCTGITYTGTHVDYGTCAVDPYVIPLGSKFYVPGYGMCTAEDIGGAIYGNKIDLGFKNIKNGWWSSRWVTIYLP